MLVEALLVAIIALIGRAETRFGMQLFIEEPLVLCTLTGAVLGDIATGLAIGATLQLVFLGNMGIGAATPSDQVLGSVIGTAIAILTGQGVEVGVALSLPVASLGQALVILIRTTLNEFFLRRADRGAAEGNDKLITQSHLLAGICYCVISAFIPAFLAVYAGTGVVENLVAVIPTKILSGLRAASKMMPALGFATLFNQMYSKNTLVYFILGFVLMAYLKVDILCIAALACCLAYIINSLTAHVD